MTQLDANHRSTLRPAPDDPDTARRARLCVAAHAGDDTLAVLEMLGLVDEAGRACTPGRASGRPV